RLLDDREKLPFFGNALQRMSAAADEGVARPDHEILDRSGDEHLARLRGGFDPRRDVDADAADVVPATLDLPRVNARADLEAQTSNPAAEGHGAGDRPGGPVEDRQHAVARAFQARPIEAAHLAAGEFVMRIQQLTP